MSEVLNRPKKHRWTPEEEVQFWLALVEAWESGEDWLDRYSEEGLDYLKTLSCDAFMKAYRKHPVNSLRSAPERMDIWSETLLWFARTDRSFVKDLVFGGIEYAKRKFGKPATIEDCLSEIRNRLYQRVMTVVFLDWIRTEIGTQGDLDRALTGTTISLEKPLGKDGDSRELGDIVSSSEDGVGESALKNELEAAAAKIAKKFFDVDCAAAEERVTLMFKLGSLHAHTSGMSKELTQAVCAELGISNFRRFSEIYRGLMRIMRERLLAYGQGDMSEDDRRALALSVSGGVETLCVEWFFSEKLKSPLFSMYQGMTNGSMPSAIDDDETSTGSN